MTYPPQQPGPYGQQPGPYGQFGPQPGQYGHFGQPGYPGGEPPKSRTGLIVAVVVIAVLVLGGGGVGVYFLTTKDDKGGSASGNPTSESQRRPNPTSENSRPTSKNTKSARPTGGDAGGSEEDLKKVANDYVTAINGADKAEATELTCDKTGPGLVYEELAGQVDEVEVSDIQMFKNNTEASVNLKRPNGTVKVPTSFNFKGDVWCVA